MNTNEKVEWIWSAACIIERVAQQQGQQERLLPLVDALREIASELSNDVPEEG